MSIPVAVLMCICHQDRPDWVETAVYSVINQVYAGPIRIYLGIDGPLRKSLKDWVDQHGFCFYKVVENEINFGLSKMLNRLLENLEDEPFLFRMDADDICLANRFSMQISFLKHNPEIDVLGGGIWEFNDKAPVAWKKSYPSRPEEIGRYIARANPLAHGTVCFRKSFFDVVPGYPEASRYNQDLGLWFLALQQGIKMANLGLPVLCLRTSDDFYCRRGYARAVSELRYYLSGIYRLHGVTWQMGFPLLRFLLRLLPSGLTRMIYHSRLRARVCRVGNTDGF